MPKVREVGEASQLPGTAFQTADRSAVEGGIILDQMILYKNLQQQKILVIQSLYASKPDYRNKSGQYLRNIR